MIAWPDPRSIQEYWVDACQRWILTLDVLRERGNIAKEQAAKQVPNVLHFKPEIVVDGRTLERPVNYGLVRIVPPEGTVMDPTKRAFVVVDPRAGHGPGIGGMKHDSEIGVALANGHPCYFVGFTPHPIPGQTIEDVCRAEAVFMKEVAARHPQADGKPVVIGNCQAGWQIMIMAATNPDLMGPIMLVGSPLSYWAGVRGKNPMRYLGGMLGGSWLTALAGDLGHGIFDGANLIANFESLNPANTYWTKGYNLYSKVDTEAPRFLEFETWWGCPVLTNAEEMQWIVDNLFVGNKLSTGQLRTSDGTRIDLRNIKSPIVVFCSWGDNITPPQQALHWVLDLYDHEREIIENGQTIVYTMHQSIGHLGIFVSGKVATKEHMEFVSCMDMIDVLPPGLYEAVITEVEPNTANPNLVHGKYLFRLEARTLDHLRALGGNSPEDELRFETVARVSETNHGMYRTLVGPYVRASVTEPQAEVMRAMHPNRLRFSMFSDDNPAMQAVKPMAEWVRQNRQPVSEDNPLLAWEHFASSWIASSLELFGQTRDALTETTFLNTYGSPIVQAQVGLGPQRPASVLRIEKDLAREHAFAQMKAQLEKRFDVGQMPEALVRALLYIRIPEGSADERGFAAMTQVRASQRPEKRKSLQEFKEIAKEQFLLLYFDEERALAALPAMLGQDVEERRTGLDILRRVLAASGYDLSAEGKRRLARIEAMFAIPAAKPQKAEKASA